jgi:hypothetical protein
VLVHIAIFFQIARCGEQFPVVCPVCRAGVCGGRPKLRTQVPLGKRDLLVMRPESPTTHMLRHGGRFSSPRFDHPHIGGSLACHAAPQSGVRSWSTTAAISDLQTGGWIGGEIAGKELVHNFVDFQNRGLLWTYC